MQHSPKFNKVKRFFDEGRWSERRVRNAVGRRITAAEYEEITGQPYEVGE